MHRIIQYLTTLLNIIHFAIPKFIRNQYSDSHLFYLSILRIFYYKWRSLFSLTPYVLQNDISKIDVKNTRLFHQNNRNSRISSPCLIYKEETIFLEELNEKVPNINVYLMENITIVGGTSLLVNIKAKKLYHFELLKMGCQHDMKASHIISNKIPRKKEKVSQTITDLLGLSNSYYICHSSKRNLKDDTIYLCLLKEHSINYYHWVTEVIPRFLVSLEALSKQENFNLNNYTLLIDANLPRQVLELLSLLVSVDMNIVLIKNAEMVTVKRLIYCSPLWLSLDNTSSLADPKKEFFVDQYALNLTRNSIKSAVPFKVSVKPFRRIYMRRLNNKLRPLSNLIQLEIMLRNQEFEFIDISTLTFLGQIRLFAEAKIVVGVSGAAFTNILFMNKGSHAISLYPSSLSTNYYVFQPLADASGVSLIHFLTKKAGFDESLHAEASVDVERLENKINELDENNGKD